MRVLDSNGRERVAQAFEASQRGLTTSDYDTYSRLQVQSAPQGDERARAFAEVRNTFPFPDRMPIVQHMAVEPLGFVWLQEPVVSNIEVAPGRRYRILSPALADLGHIEFTEPIRVHEIGENHGVGAALGPRGESIVRVYRLRRPTPAEDGPACR